MNDFHSAKLAYLNLSSLYLPGALLELPGGREVHLLSPALHSETLEPVLTVVGVAGGSFEFAYCVPGATRLLDEHADLPAELSGSIDGQVFHHRKGGVYTRIGQAQARSGETTIYVAHADGLWWIRPRAMFDDGRFEPSSEARLSLDELGLMT